MNADDLKDVLLTNSPGMPDPVLATAIASCVLPTSALKDVLLANSPLSTAVLNAAINRQPPMNSGDLSKLLSAQ